MELILPSDALKRSFIGAETSDTTIKDGSSQKTESGSYHAFHIGDIGLLIPQETISEVADELAYCQLPNTSTILFGMANLRGNIIPIFDLHELFGFVVDKRVPRKVLIIGRGENAVGILIQELPTRVLLTVEDKTSNIPPLPDSLRPYVKACYQNNGIWLNIDNNSFLISLAEHLH